MGKQPLFFYVRLSENLTFGQRDDDKAKPGAADRMYKICTRLGVATSTLAMLSSSTKIDWLRALPLSQLKGLHLARALIANPEVLALERPVDGFDRHTSDTIMRTLRQHVDERGLVIDDETKVRSRPRMVVLTTDGL